MKKILLALLLFFSLESFSQSQSVKYFGGIYDSIAYFNWVYQNDDTCNFVVEVSYDGITYDIIAKDSVRPVAFPIWHSIKIPTCEEQLRFRLVAITRGVIITFLPKDFENGKYTIEEKIYAGRIIHANF